MFGRTHAGPIAQPRMLSAGRPRGRSWASAVSVSDEPCRIMARVAAVLTHLPRPDGFGEQDPISDLASILPANDNAREARLREAHGPGDDMQALPAAAQVCTAAACLNKDQD